MVISGCCEQNNQFFTMLIAHTHTHTHTHTVLIVFFPGEAGLAGFAP